MYRCPHCGQEKPADEFYYRKTGKYAGQRSAWCKDCTKESARLSNQRNYQRNRAARNAQVVRWRRARQLGLTREEYEALGVDPGRHCAICGSTPDSPRNGAFSNGAVRSATKRLAIDHCHASGGNRGFLCSNCNNGLGRFADNPEWLRRAADYLEGCLPLGVRVIH